MMSVVLGSFFLFFPGSFPFSSSQKSPSSSGAPQGPCVQQRQSFEISCFNHTCGHGLAARPGALLGPSIPDSRSLTELQVPLVWALFKIQGIFVHLVIRSWISFVVASTTAHSEGGEFYCSETNPRALLLAGRFVPSTLHEIHQAQLSFISPIKFFLHLFLPLNFSPHSCSYLNKLRNRWVKFHGTFFIYPSEEWSCALLSILQVDNFLIASVLVKN